MNTICAKKYRDIRLLCVIFLEKRSTWEKEDLLKLINISFEEGTITLNEKNKLFRLMSDFN